MYQISQASIDIRQLSYKATNALQLAASFIKSRVLSVKLPGEDGCKWHLFLDQPSDTVEACAIALGLTTLILSGEPVNSGLMKQAKATLYHLQLPSGGWTSWVNELAAPDQVKGEALLLDTFYSLRALQLLGDTDSETFQRGLTWICKAQNLGMGGWGFFEGDDACYTLPTSYAIRILATGYKGVDPVARSIIRRGTEWLLECSRENADGVWGEARGTPSSAVHTALALMALIDAGVDIYSPIVVKSREWLLSNLEDVDHLIECYLTPSRDSGGRKISSRAIYHVNFHVGLILQSLIIAGTNLLDARLLTVVEHLIDAQVKEGYWHYPFSPKEQPIYVISDACLALNAFVFQVKEHKAVLELSERIQVIDKLIDDKQVKYELNASQILKVKNDIREIVAQLNLVRTELASIGKNLEDLVKKQEQLQLSLQRLDKGLLFLKPLINVTLFARKYPLLAIVVLLLIPSTLISIYSLIVFSETSKIYVYSSFVVSFILLVMAIISFWDQLYGKH